MAFDYKESFSTMLLTTCMCMWAFPLALVTYQQMPSLWETALANDPMHACNSTHPDAFLCAKPDGSTVIHQCSNVRSESAYWNAFLYSPCPYWDTATHNRQRENRNHFQLATAKPVALSDALLCRSCLTCCFAACFDDVVLMVLVMVTSAYANNSPHKREFQPCKRGSQTSPIRGPVLRFLCSLCLMLFSILAICHGQLLPWSIPAVQTLPKPKGPKLDLGNRQGFDPRGVYLKSSQPGRKIRTLTTIGDGNCFWRALSRQLPIKWYTLKRRVLNLANSDPTLSVFEKKEIRRLQRTNCWANALAIRCAARFLQCNIGVWYQGGMGFFTAPTTCARTMFLSLSRQHFETIPCKIGLELLTTCDPFSPVSVEALKFSVDEQLEYFIISQRSMKMHRPKFCEDMPATFAYLRILAPLTTLVWVFLLMTTTPRAA